MLLPDQLKERFARVVGVRDGVHYVREVATARRHLELGASVLVTSAPTGSDDAEALCRSLLGSGSASALVILDEFTPTAVRSILRLKDWGLRHVVFAGIDDDPVTLHQILRDASCTSVATVVAEALSRQAGVGNARLAAAVSDLFHKPARYQQVSDLARAAGMASRTLRRHLPVVGISTPKRLLAAARIAVAFDLAHFQSSTCTEAASIVGCRSLRALNEHVRDACRTTLRHLARARDPRDLASDLIGYVSAVSLDSSPPLTRERSERFPT